MTLTTSPMPHIEAGDVVEVRFPNGSSEAARVWAATHSVEAGESTFVTRWLDPSLVLGPLRSSGGLYAGEAP
jgi:hypothetical protein